MNRSEILMIAAVIALLLVGAIVKGYRAPALRSQEPVKASTMRPES